jgi:hypothetical protein
MRPGAASSNPHQVPPAARIELSSFNGRIAGNRRLRETEAMRIAPNSAAARRELVTQIDSSTIIPAENQ